MKKSASKWLKEHGYHEIGGNRWYKEAYNRGSPCELIQAICLEDFHGYLVLHEPSFIIYDSTLRRLQIMLNNVKLDVKELKEYLADTHEHN